MFSKLLWQKLTDLVDNGGWYARGSDKEFYSAGYGRAKDYIITTNAGPIATFSLLICPRDYQWSCYTICLLDLHTGFYIEIPRLLSSNNMLLLHYHRKQKRSQDNASPLSNLGQVRSVSYSWSTLWTNETAIDPSPTADTTRLMLPPRTSPTAKTPGKLVSSKYGWRARGQPVALRFSGDRSEPVLMKPLASTSTTYGLWSQTSHVPVVMSCS